MIMSYIMKADLRPYATSNVSYWYIAYASQKQYYNIWYGIAFPALPVPREMSQSSIGLHKAQHIQHGDS